LPELEVLKEAPRFNVLGETFGYTLVFHKGNPENVFKKLQQQWAKGIAAEGEYLEGDPSQ
jgi:hypothetical protein